MHPTEVILVRHGESVGNVAREQSEAAGAEEIAIGWRDPDVPLSEIGRTQAEALGRWLAERPAANRPVAVWSSPYVRAHDTATIALHSAGLALPVTVDERLRDRELGVLDRLTSLGVRSRFPTEADRRRWLGKLYYRPPGGESWADVALRLRSFLQDLTRPDPVRNASGPALIVCHDAVILLFRYVLEAMNEATLLDLARTTTVGNTSVTRLVPGEPGHPWVALEAAGTEHLDEQGVVSTEHGADYGAEYGAHPH